MDPQGSGTGSQLVCATLIAVRNDDCAFKYGRLVLDQGVGSYGRQSLLLLDQLFPLVRSRRLARKDGAYERVLQAARDQPRIDEASDIFVTDAHRLGADRAEVEIGGRAYGKKQCD